MEIATCLPIAVVKCSQKLLDSRRAMVKGIDKSCWEMPKGYWIASGQFLKAIGQLLEMLI
jgi:hypothetical protein